MSQQPKFAKPRNRKQHQPTKPFVSLVGRDPRRAWRAGEPVHVVKPVRAARLAAQRAREAEAN